MASQPLDFLHSVPTKSTINQPINQSINQPINQSINQSISQSINLSANQSINQSIDWSYHDNPTTNSRHSIKRTSVTCIKKHPKKTQKDTKATNTAHHPPTRPLRLGTLLQRLTSVSGWPAPSWLRLRCRRKLNDDADTDEAPTDSFSPKLLDGESGDTRKEELEDEEEAGGWHRPPP